MDVDKPNIQNLPLNTPDGQRLRKSFTGCPASLMMQMANAAEMERRIYAKMQDMERRGIVEHDGMDGWRVLDKKRYEDEMGMPGPEYNNGR